MYLIKNNRRFNIFEQTYAQSLIELFFIRRRDFFFCTNYERQSISKRSSTMERELLNNVEKIFCCFCKKTKSNIYFSTTLNVWPPEKWKWEIRCVEAIQKKKMARIPISIWIGYIKNVYFTFGHIFLVRHPKTHHLTLFRQARSAYRWVIAIKN